MKSYTIPPNIWITPVVRKNGLITPLKNEKTIKEWKFFDSNIMGVVFQKPTLSPHLLIRLFTPDPDLYGFYVLMENVPDLINSTTIAVTATTSSNKLHLSIYTEV